MSRKILIYLILAINIAVVLYFWWQGNNALIGSNIAETMISFGRLTGLLMVLMVLAQFVFMSRAPWVEQAFGFDKLAKVHKWNGYALFIFLISHPFLITYGYALNSGVTYFEQYQDLAQNYHDVFQAIVAYFLYIAVIIISIAIVRRRLKYETWYFAHLFVYLATALSFGHQLAVGQDLSHGGIFYYYWLGLYALVFGLFVVYRFCRPIYNFYKHRFFVSRIVRETHDVVSVYIGGRDIDKFIVKGGQFMIVRFLTKGLIFQAHPFSFSMMPKNGEIRISVKDSGDFTHDIDKIPLGTPVMIDGPHGIFTEKLAQKEKFLFVAGGIGITPIRAILESIGGRADAILLYANKTERDIALLSELEGSGVKIIHVLSGQPDYQGEKGFINGALTSRVVSDFKDRSVFICGPMPMMMSIRKDLISLGSSKSDIHFEEFAL